MPTFTITRHKKVECSDKALVIAKALHAYTNYPGRSIAEAVWPPNTNSALMRYIAMGEAVESALTHEGF